jgi:hypothetical protein
MNHIRFIGLKNFPDRLLDPSRYTRDDSNPEKLTQVDRDVAII